MKVFRIVIEQPDTVILDRFMRNDVTLDCIGVFIDEMIEDIKAGANPYVEINFCINCIESILGVDFNDEELCYLYEVLNNIIKKS
jgi:hypothetical protein